MKTKLVASIAFAMIAVIFASTFAVLPTPVHAVPNIYMTPASEPVGTPSVGMTFTVTVWLTGYVDVGSFQVKLNILPGQGLEITNAALPDPADPAYLFVGMGTFPPTPIFTPTSAQFGSLSLSGVANVPPEPAKLGTVDFLVTAAPGKFTTYTTPLNITNADTYILDGAAADIPKTTTNGVYTWAWAAPTTFPNMAVHFPGPLPVGVTGPSGNPMTITFTNPYAWNGQVFTATACIDTLDIGWAISGAIFSLTYNPTPTMLLGAVLDPAWTGTVDTTTPGIILVNAATTASLSGSSVVVLTMTFQIQNQGLVPPLPPASQQVSDMVFSGVELSDHVGPITTNAAVNGRVIVQDKQEFANPFLSVDPTSILSGTDLVIGNQFGKTFTVNVNINDLSEFVFLVGVQFRLQYDHNLVQFVGATEGPFLSGFPNQPAAPFTFFTAMNYIGDPVFGDNVAVADLLLPNGVGVWSNFPHGTGTIATLTFAYVKQDFVNTYNMPLTLVDFGTSPPTFFVNNIGETITPNPVVNGMVTIQPISTVGRRIDVWMLNYPAPYGGQGLNMPADLVVPQQEINLTAKVTYNWWPVANKKVTFNIYNNQGQVVAVLSALTGADGHAYVSFRMPWPDVNPEGLFGVWTVVASVSVADVTITDTLQFHYDYLVRITSVTTDLVSYAHLQYVHVTVAYKTQAQQLHPVTLAETLSDNLGVPVSVNWADLTVSGAVFCSYRDNYPPVTLALYIPYYAYAGLATVHVNFLDLPPTNGMHVAVTPEATATVYILPI